MPFCVHSRSKEIIKELYGFLKVTMRLPIRQLYTMFGRISVSH